MRLRPTSASRLFEPLVIATLSAVLSGCQDGPALGEVSGTVSYNGQPVPGAIVDFRPIGEGKQSMGFTNEHGEYEAEYTLRRNGALVGRHKVSVRIYPPEGAKPIPIPAKFGGNSGVEFEVQPGNNRFDIDLGSS